MVNFSTYTFTLPTKHRKTQYTLPFTLSLYQPNTVKHNILFHLHFTLSTKHRKTQYIFSATVYFFHSHFTTYDLRRFATKQTGNINEKEELESERNFEEEDILLSLKSWLHTTGTRSSGEKPNSTISLPNVTTKQQEKRHICL